MSPFRLFSLIFAYPTAGTVKEITELSRNGELPSFGCVGSLGRIPLEELQAEYTRLFISAYPALLCPPYESFYKEGIVYGGTSVEVREMYEDNCLKYAYEGEPPDHLSAELEFLAITKHPGFLERLKGWVPGFTEKVKRNSEIYGACAEALERFLNLQKINPY